MGTVVGVYRAFEELSRLYVVKAFPLKQDFRGTGARLGYM